MFPETVDRVGSQIDPNSVTVHLDMKGSFVKLTDANLISGE